MCVQVCKCFNHLSHSIVTDRGYQVKAEALVWYRERIRHSTTGGPCSQSYSPRRPECPSAPWWLIRQMWPYSESKVLCNYISVAFSVIFLTAGRQTACYLEGTGHVIEIAGLQSGTPNTVSAPGSHARKMQLGKGEPRFMCVRAPPVPPDSGPFGAQDAPGPIFRGCPWFGTAERLGPTPVHQAGNM